MAVQRMGWVGALLQRRTQSQRCAIACTRLPSSPSTTSPCCNPQASASVGVMMVAYILHQRTLPFLRLRTSMEALDAAEAASNPAQRRRSSACLDTQQGDAKAEPPLPRERGSSTSLDGSPALDDPVKPLVRCVR